MKPALAVLTVGAYASLAVAESGSAPALVLGAVFVLFSTVGFAVVRPRTGWAYAYVGAALLLAYAVFGASSSTGATLMIIVVVSQAVLVLPLAAAVVVVALTPFVHVGMSVADGLREGLGLLAAAAFAAVVTRLLVREQEARVALRAYTMQAERLATAQERNRVARDIHDGLGHALTVVQMQVKAARAVLPTDPGQADAVLAKAQDQAEEALREVRRSVGALREPGPPVPLPDALKELAATAGLPTDVALLGAARPLPAAAEESLFRAAQEGLTNVRKHAGASRAELTLDYSASARVRLEVRDDGSGPTPDGPVGFGLVGLRERAASLGGSVTLSSAPGRGALLRIEVPG